MQKYNLTPMLVFLSISLFRMTSPDASVRCFGQIDVKPIGNHARKLIRLENPKFLQKHVREISSITFPTLLFSYLARRISCIADSFLLSE